MTDKSNNFIRYTLKLPSDIHTELHETAEASGITMLDLLLRMVRLGLWLGRETARYPHAEIIIRADGYEKTLLPMLH